jgi:futalosine hydrolase
VSSGNFFPLRKVNSITVQLVHGNSMSIDKLLAREETTALESMEGAAVFYVSNQYKLPVMQIRSISNYVEPRNRSNWNIELAINNLNTSVLNFLDSI